MNYKATAATDIFLEYCEVCRCGRVVFWANLPLLCHSLGRYIARFWTATMATGSANQSRMNQRICRHFHSADQDRTVASPKSSPIFRFGDSVRESFRDLHIPNILSKFRKPASELSLVFEAVRHSASPSDSNSPPNDRHRTSRSAGHPALRRRRRNALTHWHNYSPHHLNKQIHLGRPNSIKFNLL